MRSRFCKGGFNSLVIVFLLVLMSMIIWKFDIISSWTIITIAGYRQLLDLTMISHRKDGRPIVWTYSSTGLGESDVCNDLKGFKEDADFHLHQLKSVVGNVSIYTHDPSHDHISSMINWKKNYQPHVFGTIYSFLKKNKDVNLIDVGSNIGVISLQAAIMGRRVIAIDAVKRNVQHVCASARENGADERIEIIYNAVSDIHTTIPFAMAQKGEFGVGFMDDKRLRRSKVSLSNEKFRFETQNIFNINTVLLDDLLNLPNIDNFKNVFIKIDVEGSEHKVLFGARKLFSVLKVRGVLMEWKWVMKRPESKYAVLMFMAEFGFEPHGIVKTSIGRKLNGEKMKNLDVIWLPKQ